MKIFFLSLGCDKNRVDSEYMLGHLANEAFEITDDETEAEAIVINTCAFIDAAKEESINAILEMAQYKETGNCKVLIVCGCLAQRYREEIIQEIPEVDACFGVMALDRIASAISEAMKGNAFMEFPSVEEKIGQSKAPAKRVLSTGGYFAYLKIAEGCDKHCTYCVIPSIRGPYRSVPMEALIEEAEDLAAHGVRELIIVAQETTRYGLDLYGEKRLPDLLDQLQQIDGLHWIRLLYCYPEEIDEALLDAMLRNDKVCHYLDMPIQHVNDRILKRMGRRTTNQELREKIALIREKIPDIALRTTLICGFPGETDEEHEEQMAFLDEMEFDRMGAFAYSQEENTPAALLPDQIDDAVKEDRRDEAMALQQEVILDANEARIGEHLEVMIEGELPREGVYIGRSYRDAPDVDGYVFVQNDRPLVSGDFVRVRISGAWEYDLLGVIEDESAE
ncbi:MAG: 30S ribosomal protein S12 methylthiotransferase RimO [Eubacterium sp.]|nr:30S ribosomal protein S12 methylthiotransferase RimO [Eubacterium sp.]